MAIAIGGLTCCNRYGLQSGPLITLESSRPFRFRNETCKTFLSQTRRFIIKPQLSGSQDGCPCFMTNHKPGVRSPDPVAYLQSGKNVLQDQSQILMRIVTSEPKTTSQTLMSPAKRLLSIGFKNLSFLWTFDCSFFTSEQVSIVACRYLLTQLINSVTYNTDKLLHSYLFVPLSSRAYFVQRSSFACNRQGHWSASVKLHVSMTSRIMCQLKLEDVGRREDFALDNL